MSRVGTGLSSKTRIYTAAVGASVVQLASITGNARNAVGQTTLPILLVTDMSQPSGASSCVQGLNIRNTGSNDLFVVSSSDATSASGYPVKANEAVPVDIRDGMGVYLVSPSGTTIAVWEV